MISPDGHPVGVFAIFGTEPRITFNAAQRRELAAYSAMALKDISQQAIWLSDAELHSPRSTPLLDRDSGYRPTRAKQSVVDIDQTLVPHGLRYHKTKTPPAEMSRVFFNRQLSPSVLSEQTPPSSSEGSENDTFPGSPRGFGKNYKQLSVNSQLNHIRSKGDLITPDSEGFRVPSPRPFSASDLTSLNLHPPNTPLNQSQDLSSHSYNYSELTVENFLSLSDNDCAEQDSPPLIDLSTPEKQLKKTKKKKRQRLTPPVSSRLTIPSISTMDTSESRDSKNPKVQAALACAGFARKLGFDLMYVLAIQPIRSSMTEQELFAPGGVQTNLMVVYGLKKRMDFDPILHINVLRGRGYQSITDKDATLDNGDYRVGVLIPLQTDNEVPVMKRSTGLIFAAYRLPRPSEIGQPLRKESQERIKELKDAALALKHILLGESEDRRSPRKFNSEPSSPKRYLANEAQEVGKHLLDETPERYFSDEAVESERWAPELEKTPTFQSRYPAGEAIEVGHFLRDDIPDRYLDNEATEVTKPSLESTKSLNEAPQPKRLTKSSKASSKSGKADKLDKARAVEVSTDAAMERPFHAVSRFRPF